MKYIAILTSALILTACEHSVPFTSEMPTNIPTVEAITPIEAQQAQQLKNKEHQAYLTESVRECVNSITKLVNTRIKDSLPSNSYEFTFTSNESWTLESDKVLCMISSLRQRFEKAGWVTAVTVNPNNPWPGIEIHIKLTNK